MRTPILDHGYLEVIEHWGSDEHLEHDARYQRERAERAERAATERSPA